MNKPEMWKMELFLDSGLSGLHEETMQLLQVRLDARLKVSARRRTEEAARKARKARALARDGEKKDGGEGGLPVRSSSSP
jgi:hypothetical protein